MSTLWLIIAVACAILLLKWAVTLVVTCVLEWRCSRSEERLGMALSDLVSQVEKLLARRKQDWSPREDETLRRDR